MNLLSIVTLIIQHQSNATFTLLDFTISRFHKSRTLSDERVSHCIIKNRSKIIWFFFKIRDITERNQNIWTCSHWEERIWVTHREPLCKRFSFVFCVGLPSGEQSSIKKRANKKRQRKFPSFQQPEWRRKTTLCSINNCQQGITHHRMLSRTRSSVKLQERPITGK